ncbi:MULTISPECIES: hypothetical protein [Sphingomonadales]|jgi:hypothetical protein|uniref:Uncharacterized protein n=2 Tax=Sphingomonadaceae TaxID=41297 RepID=A0A397PK13_9SPHN|nr:MULTISPECIES: hypothetical protein [Sphingomonadaceae]EKU73303.1 hypothetical protein HMPREF9718_03772 [Sphingobium yanoikuyae ATCC 51230]RIA46061.1 hypothetical protein DFR49_0590 [Hephaestia caeni]WQE08084.1 hypothetical protein U0025_04145 [Sphingobium yanoikuyae]
MSLPVVYQPSIASETDGTMRFLLQVIAIWSESKKPDIAEMDEFWEFFRAIIVR